MEFPKEQEQILERAGFIGKQMERKIEEGNDVFLEEKDRLFLKEMLQRNGRSLEQIKGAGDLSQQAENLVAVFGQIGDETRRNQGCDGVAAIVTDTVVGLLDSKSGNVFDEGTDIGEVEEGKVAKLIENYFEGFYEKEFKVVLDKYAKGTWERRTQYRIEAVLAVTNKILWILAAESEEEARRRQNTTGMLKHLRERVIRGIEKEEGIELNNIARIDKNEVIRLLPKGGLEYILDTLMRL